MTTLCEYPARFGLALFLIIAAAGNATFAQDDIVASVNGEPITGEDVDQRSNLLEAFSPTHATPSQQEILETLINEKVVAPTARRLHMTPSDMLRIAAKSQQGLHSLHEMRRQALIEYRQ
jgi:hypothetical protein